MTLGSILLFVPMLGLGLEGMRRRIVEAPAVPVFHDLHLITVAGGFLVFAGLVVFAYNLVVSLRRGPAAGNNPWGGRTLEWMVSSPPPENNFDEIPQVLDRPHLHGVAGSIHARVGAGTGKGTRDT
jgi:heme/copper-type cytochrome/quinol oxidase subunit 1